MQLVSILLIIIIVSTSAIYNFDLSCPQSNNYTNSGSITSPGYPSNYANDLYCLYNLIVPIDDRIQLTFTHFDTGICCDFVIVYDGPSVSSNVIQKLFGNLSLQLPIVLKSTTNLMLVEFSTDHTDVYDGWSATFEIDNSIMTTTSINSPDTCPINNHYVNDGTFASPGYPYSSYGNNLMCNYYITVPIGHRVSIEFIQSFSTESCCDVVTLYNGSTTSSSVIKRLSGQLLTPTDVYYTTVDNNQMLVTFVTDSTNTYAGWRARFFYDHDDTVISTQLATTAANTIATTTTTIEMTTLPTTTIDTIATTTTTNTIAITTATNTIATTTTNIEMTTLPTATIITDTTTLSINTTTETRISTTTTTSIGSLNCSRNSTGSNQCLSSDWTIDPNGYSCYNLSQLQPLATFDNARESCQLNNSELASIHCDRQNKFLANYVNCVLAEYNYYVWIGLYRTKDDEYSWTDGSVKDYTAWLDGKTFINSCSDHISIDEPATSIDDNCTAFQTWPPIGWRSIPCSTMLSFICANQQI